MPVDLPYTGTGLIRVNGAGKVVIVDPSTLQEIAVWDTAAGWWTFAGTTSSSDPSSLLNDYWCPPPSGSATTDTNAISKQINNAINAGSGRVILQRTKPGSPYLLNASLPAITLPGVSLIGPGSSSCVLQPTAALTGDLIRVQMNPFTTDPSGAVWGFTIDGTNAGAGATGLHYGDAIEGRLGVWVKNFSGAGSKGIWIDNRTNWTERTVWDPSQSRVDNCTIGILFDVNGGTTSMGYQEFAAYLKVLAGQVGIRFQNGAQLYNGKFKLRGNMTAATGTALSLLDTAQIGPGTEYSVAVEDAVAGATGLSMAVGTKLGGHGVIDFQVGGLTNANAGTGNIQFGGWFNCPGIHAELGEAMVAFGGVSIKPGPNQPTGPGNWADASGNVYLFALAGGGFITFRPAGANSANNQLQGNAGNWTTFDGAGVARNVLDDAAGNIKAKVALFARGAAPAAGAGEVAIGATTATTIGAAGAAAALPANPVGYLIINVAGTQVKIPYYNP